MAASDIVIEVDGKITENSAGGFLDTITDLNFGSTFIVEISGSLSNYTAIADPGVPSVNEKTFGGAKLIWKKVTPVTEIIYYCWQPYMITDYTFGRLTGGCSGSTPWEARPAYIGYNTLDDTLRGINLPAGSMGNVEGPISAPDSHSNPNYFNTDWQNIGGSLGPFSSLAVAQAYATFMSAGWGFVGAGCYNGVDLQFQTTYNMSAGTSWRHTVNFDYLFKVYNSKSAKQISIVAAGLSNAPEVAAGGITVDLYTTENNTGSINIPPDQIAQIKTPDDLRALGMTSDASTGGSIENNTYSFTFWRDNKAVPLYTGAHIEATPPIPSV